MSFRGCPKFTPVCLTHDSVGRQRWCVRILRMSQAAQAITRPPSEVVRETPVSQAPNGICYEFSDLVWKQSEASVRGETSLDAWESRKLATAHTIDADKHKNEYFAAAFSDAISIYLLSLSLDVDYHDLRERDYPLLAPAAMAERLRKIAEMFPPNQGFEFAVYYRRRP